MGNLDLSDEHKKVIDHLIDFGLSKKSSDPGQEKLRQMIRQRHSSNVRSITPTDKMFSSAKDWNLTKLMMAK